LTDPPISTNSTTWWGCECEC